MPDSLLPLNAMMEPLRGFVAVGRHMSVTLAAQELCLTQSAVSRQVQALEQRLGVKLLRRGHRSVTFTAEGERLFRDADLALRQLQQAIAAVATTTATRPVTLSASIGLTALWLLPRLGRFQQRHPTIDLRVAASNRLVDLPAENVDLAIRYCAHTDAPAGGRHLFDERIAPVASPLPKRRRLRTPADLDGQVLLEYEDAQRPWLQWRDWLQARGWKIKPKAILRFNQYDQVVHSALAGQGIALGRLPLLGQWLKNGHLRTLDTPRAPQGTDHAYWLLQGDDAPRDSVNAVIAWLRSEAAAT
nr:LysR substrate-binding domain-containing protein [Dyella sp. ASV24]